MKRSMLLAMGCALVLAGCGSTDTAADTEAQTAAETATEAPAAETTTEAAAETEAATDEAMGDATDNGEELTPSEDGTVSNSLFSITMPADTAGTYLAFTSNENDISIYDKEASEGGFGGFAFQVCATDTFENFGGMKTKIGELTDADGKLYHVYISYPSDVQWDYTKSDGAPATYHALYDNARDIAATMQSVNGGTYVDGAGTKGEEIYADYVKEIISTIENAKDATELEAANLSPEYYAMTQGDAAKDPMEAMGVCYTDINWDGVDEMVIGDMDSKVIYDIFAIVNDKPDHVISGYSNDYFKVYGHVLAQYTREEADVSTITTYELIPNTSELFPQYSIKLDETADAKNKWSVSYDEGTTWEELTEEDYNIRLSNIEDFPAETEPTYTALSKMK